MGSNLLSRFLPPTSENQSVYEAIRQHDEAVDDPYNDAYADAAVDDQNLQEQFHDQDLDQLLTDATSSRITSNSAAFSDHASQQEFVSQVRPEITRQARPLGAEEEHKHMNKTEDEEIVPDSLLLEDRAPPSPESARRPRAPPLRPTLPSPVPGPSPRPKQGQRRVQWDTPRIQHRLSTRKRLQTLPEEPHSISAFASADPADKAMWRWANVENLDNFLQDVYGYYVEKGFWSIMLSRLINTLTLAFIVGLGTFLTFCIDYKKVQGSQRLSDIKVYHCSSTMSGAANLLLWLFTFYWIFKVVEYLIDIRRLWHLHEFFKHLLQISDDELQTISWQAVVGRLMDLRDANPRTALQLSARNQRFIGEQSKQRMDAHDIANRLMRKENYLIALFNKEILNLTLPVPFLKNRQLFSKNLEWSINLCVTDYVFNDQGQVQQLFLKDSHRRELVEAMQRRFLLVGFINVICAPFIVTYFLMFFFLRYFKEFQRNPAELGARSYTPFAEWKFREFNELSHFFHTRLNMSHPFASHYIDQFPKEKTAQVARFVAFVAGALATVLAVASLLDPEVFLGFELTHDRTVLFYLGVLTTVWAVARGLVPEDNFVFDPEYSIKEVIKCTHYKPAWWEGKLHSDSVRRDFSALYQVKIVIFLEEIMSIIFTPFVLWFSLPKCSERLVDFFREFTVHVDGLGYVCSFALFEFHKGGAETKPEEPLTSDACDAGLRDEYYSTKDGKMLSSYYSFLNSYATNQKRATTPQVARRNFQPPPDFPGLSPTTQNNPTRPTHQENRSRGDLRHSQRPTSAHEAEPPSRDLSPSPSVLLDPQHQPSLVRERVQLRGPPPSKRGRPSMNSREDISRDQELGRRDGVSSSALIDEDSNLGDSWKATKAAVATEEGRAGPTAAEPPKEDAGVLGLLYQFQKAQTEGKGGVNI